MSAADHTDPVQPAAETSGDRGDRIEIGGGAHWRRYTPVGSEALYELMAPDGGFVNADSSTEAEARVFAAALSTASAVGADRVVVPREPVAWRVRDYTNSWTLHQSEASAIAEAGGTGTPVEPLYTAASPQAPAAEAPTPLFDDLTPRQKLIAETLFNLTSGGADDTLMDMAASIACAQAVEVDRVLSAANRDEGGVGAVVAEPALYEITSLRSVNGGGGPPSIVMDFATVGDRDAAVDALYRIAPLVKRQERMSARIANAKARTEVNHG